MKENDSDTLYIVMILGRLFYFIFIFIFIYIFGICISSIYHGYRVAYELYELCVRVLCLYASTFLFLCVYVFIYLSLLYFSHIPFPFIYLYLSIALHT